MEKKVRYLMLLLCLSLFPFRVYALDQEIQTNENNDQSNVVVESKNDLNDNQIDNSSEEKETPAEPGDEEKEEEAEEETNDGEELTPALGQEAPENEGEEETTLDNNVETLEGDTVQGTDDEPTVTQIGSVTITGANLDVVAGKEFTFSGKSGEPEKYSLVREEWNSYGNVVASSTGTNTQATADEEYEYTFVVALANGYAWSSFPDEYNEYEVSVNLNGTNYTGYAIPLAEEGENVYMVYPTCWVTALDESIVYIDNIEIENAVLKAYIGQTPLFGATVNNEHFKVWTEAWDYEQEVQLEDGNIYYDYYYNISNPNSYDTSSVKSFQTFESGHTYWYMILVEVENGYRLSNTNNLYHDYQYQLKINGTAYSTHGYSFINDESGKVTYLFEIDNGFEPEEANTLEVTENANPSITEGEASDITIGVSGDFSTFENIYFNGTLLEETNYEKSGDKESTKITFLSSFLNTLAQGVHNITLYFKNGIANTDLTVNPSQTTTTSTNTTTTTSNSGTIVVSYLTEESTGEETKTTIDVKKDTKEKKDNKKDSKEEEETTSSNLGLIIFLIILVTIAIAIPITVYRKKQ